MQLAQCVSQGLCVYLTSVAQFITYYIIMLLLTIFPTKAEKGKSRGAVLARAKQTVRAGENSEDRLIRRIFSPLRPSAWSWQGLHHCLVFFLPWSEKNAV